MITNYVVRIKNVKVDRLNTFIRYLNDEKHKNHTKKNTVITELSDRELFHKTAREKVWKNSESYVRRGRGGRRLKVVGKSLTFNIPPMFDFNDQTAATIKNLILEGIKNLYNSYGYDLQEEEVYMVLHNQDNPHYHLFIPYLDMEGKPLRDTKPKQFLNELKLLWNTIMIDMYGIDLEQYQPLDQEEQEENKNRRYLGELKDYYLSEFDIEEDDYINNQVKRINRLLKLKNEELDQKENDIESLEKNLKKVIKKHNTTQGK